MQKNIFDFTYEALIEEMVILGEKSFRAKQIWLFLYIRGVNDFSQMISINKLLREKLAVSYSIILPKIINHQLSDDGTCKFLLQFADQNEIETVYIPTENRGTLCISSQVGCNMGCTFCNTGTQRMVRNLTTSEILGQVILIKHYLKDFLQHNVKHKISNVVFMGMGEPLHNYHAVVNTIKILNHSDGLAISKRKITISTCGIIPNIKRLSVDAPVNLSLSLHATNDNLRDMIMPINKSYTIDALLNAVHDYYKNSSTKLITLVYLMINGVNDLDEHLVELLELVQKIPCKVNLIPFHSWKGSFYQSSSNNRIRYFADFLAKNNITTTIRLTRGIDVSAACGQLKSSSKKKSIT